jgi:hypothetical protein
MIERRIRPGTLAAAAPPASRSGPRPEASWSHAGHRAVATVAERYRNALRAPPPLWTLAAAIVLCELVLTLAGQHSPALSALAVVAPGWALIPLLPAPLRIRPLAAIVAAPALGLATVSVLLITLARIGVTLDGVSVRIALIALVALALGTWDREVAPLTRSSPAGLLEAAGLLVVLALGVGLGLRVVGSKIPPGNDWAKYLLYAEQVRIHGSMLIRNPYWMLGQPFRDDPGVPSIYAAILILSRAPAGVLTHGIIVFTALEIVTVYAFARAYWGRAAGVLAAALVAVVPASQDILGWYGLANLDALVLLALLLAYLASYTGYRASARSTPAGLGARASVGLALTLLGLLAAHRLSGFVGLALVALVAGACLLSPTRRRRAWADGIRVAAVTLIGGAGVIADLYTRERSFGGSLPYTDYLDTKVNLTLALRDVSPMLAGAVGVALVLIVVLYRREGALWGPIALLAVSVGLAYSWKLHLPNYYARMVFYVPVAASPLIAAVAVRLRPRWLIALAAAAGIVLTAQNAYNQAQSVHSYYTFVTPSSLRGLDALSAVLRPDEVVVTDRCWSFLATWLLHTRTLAALEPQDIQPAAELPFAREAQQILDGSRRGRALAHRLGVRYLVVDPVCPGADGSPLPPPGWGRPVYESARLAILRLPGATASSLQS